MSERRLKTRSPTVFVTLVTLAALAALGACGSDRTGGPRGDPEAVVRRSPDLTLAAGAASVDVSAPDARTLGRLRLDGSKADLTVTGPGKVKNYPELDDPLGLVELIRGAVGVESYGGVAVRGVSTFRYELNVNVERALAMVEPGRRQAVAAFAGRLNGDGFYADVWVDSAGRLRRIQVPVDKMSGRPAAHERKLPSLISVDLFEYTGED